MLSVFSDCMWANFPSTEFLVVLYLDSDVLDRNKALHTNSSNNNKRNSKAQHSFIREVKTAAADDDDDEDDELPGWTRREKMSLPVSWVFTKKNSQYFMTNKDLCRK